MSRQTRMPPSGNCCLTHFGQGRRLVDDSPPLWPVPSSLPAISRVAATIPLFNRPILALGAGSYLLGDGPALVADTKHAIVKTDKLAMGGAGNGLVAGFIDDWVRAGGRGQTSTRRLRNGCRQGSRGADGVGCCRAQPGCSGICSVTPSLGNWNIGGWHYHCRGRGLGRLRSCGGG